MDLIAFFESIPAGYMDPWSYVFIFIIAFLESTPLFGFFIPGPTTIVIAGFLARLGLLHAWMLIIAASLGSILGDMCGYLIGRKYGYSFLISYGRFFFFKKEYYFSIKELMTEHAGKAIVIGRFNALTRAIAPFVAGSSEIKFGRFMTYNVIAGTAWSACFVLLGVLFGHSYTIAVKYLGRAFIVLLLWLILAFVMYSFFYKKKKLVKEQPVEIPKSVEKIIKAKSPLKGSGKLAKKIRKGKERLRRARAELKARKRARLQDRKRHLRHH